MLMFVQHWLRFLFSFTKPLRLSALSIGGQNLVSTTLVVLLSKPITPTPSIFFIPFRLETRTMNFSRLPWIYLWTVNLIFGFFTSPAWIILWLMPYPIACSVRSLITAPCYIFLLYTPCCDCVGCFVMPPHSQWSCVCQEPWPFDLLCSWCTYYTPRGSICFSECIIEN